MTTGAWSILHAIVLGLAIGAAFGLLLMLVGCVASEPDIDVRSHATLHCARAIDCRMSALRLPVYEATRVVCSCD